MSDVASVAALLAYKNDEFLDSDDGRPLRIRAGGIALDGVVTLTC